MTQTNTGEVLAMSSVESTVSYRPVTGFPGYRVGDDGSVWNAWVNCRWGRRLTERWKRLKPGVHRRGYLYVNLTPPGGRYRSFRVHRLVLEAFVGPCPPGMECRHLNGVKADCRLGNLAWGTPERNRQDNHEFGVYGRGSDHTQAKLTAEKVREIRRRHAAGELQRVLAAEFEVEVSNICAIVNRRSWKHID